MRISTLASLAALLAAATAQDDNYGKPCYMQVHKVDGNKHGPGAYYTDTRGSGYCYPCPFFLKDPYRECEGSESECCNGFMTVKRTVDSVDAFTKLDPNATVNKTGDGKFRSTGRVAVIQSDEEDGANLLGANLLSQKKQQQQTKKRGKKAYGAVSYKKSPDGKLQSMKVCSGKQVSLKKGMARATSDKGVCTDIDEEGNVQTTVYRGKDIEVNKGPVKATVGERTELITEYDAETGQVKTIVRQEVGGTLDLGPAGTANVGVEAEFDAVGFFSSGGTDWDAISVEFKIEVRDETCACTDAPSSSAASPKPGLWVTVWLLAGLLLVLFLDLGLASRTCECSSSSAEVSAASVPKPGLWGSWAWLVTGVLAVLVAMR